MEQLMLDLIPTGAKAVCHVSQNDIGRTIRFNLTSGGTAYTLAGTETIKVYIKKPDGTTAERNIANTSSTYVDWVTGEGDCDVAGKNECELVITSGTIVIGSKNFTMKVEEDPYNGQGVVIETAGPAPVATFDTNIIDLFVEIKCTVNAVQEGTPWIDSNVIEKEPYNFRKIAGTASRIGNHLFDKLVGGTVAWNQLAPNNFNVSKVSEIMFDSDVTIVEGHKYFISRKLGSTKNVADAVYAKIDGANVLCFQITAQNTETIAQSTYSGKAAIASYIEGAVWIYHNSAVPVTDLNIIDLTAMFGSTIADYIYSLEQATAGAGVSWFRKLFPKPYYAYNAGELMSVKTTAHKMVGKNLFDKTKTDVANGYVANSWLTENNGIVPDVDCDISEYIQVPANTIFSIKGTTYGNPSICFYDSNKTLISGEKYNSRTEFAFTTPTNTAYLRFSIIKVNIDTTQIEIGSTATAYEPYIEHNYALDDVELRGLFKLDSNNKLYADGDTYESSGAVTRKYGIVDLGSLDWAMHGTIPNAFYTNGFTTIKLGTTNFICAPYENGGTFYDYNLIEDKKMYSSTSLQRIAVKDTAFSDATAFKNSLNGKYLVYEAETATTESADPFTNPQQVDANGTEEYIDSRTPAIPVGHETYYADIYDISGFTACKVSVKDGSNVERKSATIQFGQTVYGGYLEYKNGAWVFTGTKKIMSGSIVVRNVGHSSAANTEYADIYYTDNGIDDTIVINSESISNIAEQINSSETGAENKYKVFASAITMYNKNFTSVENAERLLNGSQFVITLATPFTLTLTGAQLETLLGENRVSHNCNGDTEVKYLYNA